MKRRDFLGLLGSGVVGTWGRGQDEVLVERWSWVMGQAAHIMVYATSEAQGLEACATALSELRRVEARLSRFDESSDLSELNRHAGRGAMRVDRDLAIVLRLAAAYRGSTGGAFDVAVEPLMRAWGFHRPRRDPPSPAELAAARAAVAAAEIRLDGDRVQLVGADTQLDLGGIGVGYGIDRAMMVLRAAGIRRAFVDVSGDCRAMGAPPGELGGGWLVAIDGVPRRVTLRDAALATSANTVSVIRYGHAVRGHVMDPVTGWPADQWRQVTVVADSGVAADALSTAALVSARRPPGVQALVPLA